MECKACELIYDVKDTDQVSELHDQISELHQKLDTGKYLLFGQTKDGSWIRVFFLSLGLACSYKLVKKKGYPTDYRCGNCMYFKKCFCSHKKSKDDCGDRDEDDICNIDSYVPVPYNWERYSEKDKENYIFRHRGYNSKFERIKHGK